LIIIAPLAHGVKIFGFSQMEKQSGIAHCVSEGLLLSVGALFYTIGIEIMRSDIWREKSAD
jgi:hypothetical protein